VSLLLSVEVVRAPASCPASQGDPWGENAAAPFAALLPDEGFAVRSLGGRSPLVSSFAPDLSAAGNWLHCASGVFGGDGIGRGTRVLLLPSVEVTRASAADCAVAPGDPTPLNPWGEKTAAHLAVWLASVGLGSRVFRSLGGRSPLVSFDASDLSTAGNWLRCAGGVIGGD
jgi:hypothetical protein